ncbi:MAG TPA: Na-translocating system protein MpsC family protein [Solirubrobacteraceae bacterium]|nr:Na-translocating system protein MpsC family protein [Solirubrobacteraceae bacterium]
MNDAMIALHERYHGRKPVTARTQMLGDDMLACLSGDVYTDVEKTMIELEREALVHETRSAFQRATERRFIRDVERLTGRRVSSFMSTHHVGPDLELELFVLEPCGAPVRHTGPVAVPPGSGEA